MDGFIKDMPKIELHAHLNSSLINTSIEELGKALYGDVSEKFLQFKKDFLEFEDNVDLNKSFEKFKFMHQLTETREGLALATNFVIRDFANDNVIYLELRTTPKTNEHMTQKEYLECVIDAMQEAMKQYPTIKVKLLPSFDRSRTIDAAKETLRNVLLLQHRYPDLIVGMDLSGNPYNGAFKDFAPLLSVAYKNGLKLALHCAEMHNPLEIDEMVVFGMQRCGHGTFLSDKQLHLLEELDTVIECCLTSNVKCKTVCSYEDHHFKHLYANGKNVVICTDGTGIFDTSLSNELNIASKVFRLSENDICKLQLNAVEHCFASHDEKDYLRERIRKYLKR